ncbi:MAG: hypothetical protein GX620_00215 [Chloroflexi bacterium]|nr:hypothetical protein [Chloroflexota bacterium]
MQRSDYRATAVVALGLVIASLTGFARQAVLASRLGVGAAADTFLVAYILPEFVSVALPIVLTPAFLPLFASLRLREGDTSAWRLAFQISLLLVAVLAVITLLAAVTTPVYLPILAPGFRDEQVSHAVAVSRLMLPAIVLMGLVSLFGPILQVYRRFWRPALGTGAFNVGFAATLLAPIALLPLHLAAWGVVVGTVLALGLLLPLVWRHRPQGFDWISVRPEPTVRDFARLAGPMLIGYAVHHIVLLVDRAMATQLGTGSASSLNYAYHIALAVGQISGLAVSTAVFPRVSEQLADDDVIAARGSLSDALRLAWVIGVPAALFLIVLRQPLIELLLEHGAFGPSATLAVAGPLFWYALAVLSDALCQPLWRTVYAGRLSHVVISVNLMQTAIRIAASFVLTASFGYNGLAISAFIGLTLQAVVLGAIVRRRIGSFLGSAWWRQVALSSLAAAIAAIASYLVGRQAMATHTVIQIGAGGIAGGALYVAALATLTRWERRLS